MSKKLSLLVACLGITSSVAIAQDGAKVRKTQEPVRIAPTEKVKKAEAAPVSEKKADPATTSAKSTEAAPVKLTPVKRIPVKATAKPVPAKAKAIDVK